MQKYLIWSIPFTFMGNLFCYAMMVVGAAKRLLVFAIIVTLLNLFYNAVLVSGLGLAGSCIVIILTKVTMTMLAFLYCQIRFRFFSWRDFLFPVGLVGISLCIFLLIRPQIPLQPAVALTLVFYCLVLWRLGMKFLGELPPRKVSKEEVVVS